MFVTTTQAGKTYAYYVDTYGLYVNDGWTLSKGLEFTLRTGMIRPLNMELRVVGSYSRNVFGRGMKRAMTMGRCSARVNSQCPRCGCGYTHRVVVSLANEVARPSAHQLLFAIHSGTAGLWATVRVEQTVWERYQNMNTTPVDLSLLTPTERLQRALMRRSSPGI